MNQSQDLAPPQEGPAGLPVVWNNRRLAPAQLRQAALVLRDMGPAAKVLIYTLRYAHSAGPMGNLSAIQQKTDGPYARQAQPDKRAGLVLLCPPLASQAGGLQNG